MDFNAAGGQKVSFIPYISMFTGLTLLRYRNVPVFQDSSAAVR